MSTRLYPLYQRGNPQLRVLLPNFWMCLVPSRRPMPANCCKLHVSPQMTHHDVHQYLTKVYKVPVLHVVVSERLGAFRKEKYVIKEDDYKVAYVTMPSSVKFEFPDLGRRQLGDSDADMEDDVKQYRLTKENFEKQMAKHANRPGVPAWFN